MDRGDDLYLVRETVRLLENTPLKDWPSFDVEPEPFAIFSMPVGRPGEDSYAEISKQLAELKISLKRADNDLSLQIGRARVAIEEIRHGRLNAFMWPDAPMRVAILLRRRGECDLEKRFLSAFLRRFPDGVGAKFRKLVERFEKL